MDRARGGYATTNRPQIIWVALADVAHVLTDKDGQYKWTESATRALLDTAGYPVPQRTLNGWLNKLQEGSSLYLSEKKTGGVVKLADEDFEILIGFLYNNYLEKVKQEWNDAVVFVIDELGIALSPSRIIACCVEAGFSCHSAILRSGSYALDFDIIAEGYVANVESLREAGFFDRSHSLIFSGDFTFTSKQLKSLKTISPNGLRQPQLNVNEGIVFTDGIYTQVSAAGDILVEVFSANEDLDTSNPQKLLRIKKMCQQTGFDWKHIHFSKQESTYTREGPNLYYHALKGQKIPRNAVILSDDGGGWKVGPKGNKQDVYLEYFSAHGIYYPPAHMFQSPNELCHGVAKQQLKKFKHKYQGNQALRTLYLAGLLAKISREQIVEWWRKCLFIGQELTLVGVMEVMRGQGAEKKKLRWYEECQEKYLTFLNVGRRPEQQRQKKSRSLAMIETSAEFAQATANKD